MKNLLTKKAVLPKKCFCGHLVKLQFKLIFKIMKKLLFSLSFIILFNFVSNAQGATDKKYKISCITTSCCGIGPFGIEIWSETTCVYVSAGKNVNGDYTYSMSFQSNEKVSKVTVAEDVLLAGLYNKKEKI